MFAKIVPQLLTKDQKNNCLSVCYDLRERVWNDPQLLSKVVTGGETWCYGYDLETKQALSQWKTPNSPRPKKGWQVPSIVKIMLISFFFCNANGIVHKEFVRLGQTVNQQFYLKMLKRLCDSVLKKNRNVEQWWLVPSPQHAPAHTALSVQQLLAKNNMTVITHPSYSPDLAPCEFFLFPRMKGKMKGKRNSYVREVKRKRWTSWTTSALKSSRNVFNSGKNVGTSVSSEKEREDFEGDWSCNSTKPNKPF